jgi:hypothetical protein
MGGASNPHGEDKNSLAMNFKRRDHLGDTCVDGRVIQGHYFI